MGGKSVHTVTLSGVCRLAELLGHLYVLIPVLDREKHYYVGADEVEKLLRHGAGWLAAHPERETIVQRYLLRKRSLTRVALDRLIAEEEGAESDDELTDTAATTEPGDGPAPGESPGDSLNEQRLNAVLAALKASGATRVLDLGCGEGNLLRKLLADHAFTEIVGMDVAHRQLERAAQRLRLERLPEKPRARLRLLQGSLVYRDARLAGFAAAAVVEVIEHLDPSRLAAFEQVLFAHARPGLIALTTPNADYNVRYGDLHVGAVRHHDHRFEWTRAEFRAWAEGVAARHGYGLRLLPVGPEDAEVGAATQLGIFTRGSTDDEHPDS